MAGILTGFLLERLREVFLNLRAELVEKQLPLTIIGKDYKLDSLKCIVAEDQATPLIKEDQEVGQEAVSVAYGPLYSDLESDMWRKAKYEAWNHVLSSSGRDHDETTCFYVEAVRRVEVEGRALYGDSIAGLTSDEFIWNMIIDGCFLLQVALFVLGGSKQLKQHRRDFPFVGETECGIDKVKTVRAALSSMFVVGNQIPLVVLNELMKQSFFKDVVNGGKWEQPLELERWVLFELLLMPAMLDARGGGGGATIVPTTWLRDYSLISDSNIPKPRSNFSGSRVMGFIRSSFNISFADFLIKRRAPSTKANDLLHGLWLLMTGLSQSMEDDIDAEDDEDCNSSYDVVLPTVRSATELKEAGIIFRYNEGTRINRIRFEKIMFNVFLVLPRIVLNSDQEMFTLFSNLINYEVIHFNRSRQKVCEYLQLMRELIRSPDDAKVLAGNGIIVVDPDIEEKVPCLFKELPIPRTMRSHCGGYLRRVRDEVNSYTRPCMFKKLGDVLSFVIILTLIQTVYTVIAYHMKK